MTRAFFSSVLSRSAAAAASLAVVASAGIVAVHPNGASLVAVPARLGQATAEAAPAFSASTLAAVCVGLLLPRLLLLLLLLLLAFAP